MIMSKNNRFVTVIIVLFAALLYVDITFIPKRIAVAANPVEVSAMDMELIKERMLELLLDPLSAEYVNTKAYEIENDRGRIVCTQYNSKNKFGGYTEFKHYMINIQNDKFVDEKIDKVVAKKTCEKLEQEHIIFAR